MAFKIILVSDKYRYVLSVIGNHDVSHFTEVSTVLVPVCRQLWHNDDDNDEDDADDDDDNKNVIDGDDDDYVDDGAVAAGVGLQLFAEFVFSRFLNCPCGFACHCVSVPNMGARHCLDPKGNGVSLGKGGEGGPDPPKKQGKNQSVVNVGRDNKDKDEEERTSRAWWRRITANRVSYFPQDEDYLINVN